MPAILTALSELSDTLLTRLGRYQVAEKVGPQRLTIVQFGEYAEAVERFSEGGRETYYGQRYTVEFVGSLAARAQTESLTVVNLSVDAPPRTLPNKVHVRSLELYPRNGPSRHRQLTRIVAATRPTHLIVMSPIAPLIRWGIRARIPVLPMFADSFREKAIGARLRARLLAYLLNDPSLELVANHNVAASRDLQRIGVDPRKIVPFDWPALVSAASYEPKRAPHVERPFRLIYVGSLVESKGVGDVIRAVALLRGRGLDVELTIIGAGIDSERLKAQACADSVEGRVFFLGRNSHPEVLAAMRAHDAVVVPSHWAYPEGLPMTIYEALCTRTPLLTSDHPMFALKLRDRDNALIFHERDPDGLARCIEELAGSAQLYAKLSTNAGKAAEMCLCPLKYDRLLSDFIAPERRRRLRDYSLAEYAYA
ncbi:MAG TPA: glycosyltransferase [Steroidobacteraceae bacterium]